MTDAGALQGVPASFALPAAGRFLDSMHNVKIDSATSKAFLRLIRVLSMSYQDIKSEEALNLLQPILGEDYAGQCSGVRVR